MTHAIDAAAVDRAVFQQAPQPVGQLDFTGAILGGFFERREDVGRQHVATDDRQIGWRFVARRLLHEIANLVDAGPHFLRVDDPVGADIFAGDFFDREHRPAQFLEHVDHLAQRRRIRIDHIIAENHREGFRSDQGAGDEHRMPQAQRLTLSHVRKVDQVRDLPDFVEQLGLPAGFEKGLELDRDVEVIFDRILAATGDEDDVVDAGRERLLDAGTG